MTRVIDYGRRERAKRARRLIGFLAACGVLSALVWLLPNVMHRAKLWSLERRCMFFNAPADLMVDHCGKVSDASPHYEREFPGLEVSDGDERYRARCWRDYMTMVRSFIVGAADTDMDSPYRMTAFLHELRTATGLHRLVCLELQYMLNGHGCLDAIITTVEPAGVLGEPKARIRCLSGSNNGTFGYAPGPMGDLEKALDHSRSYCIYAGQLDPSDASHFRVRIQIDGKQSYLEGWLRDDGSVKLGMRDGQTNELREF